VLVGAGEEEGLVAGEAVVAGEDVGTDGRVDVSEVGLGVGIFFGGGYLLNCNKTLI
jgi:hypothetical protein